MAIGRSGAEEKAVDYSKGKKKSTKGSPKKANKANNVGPNIRQGAAVQLKWNSFKYCVVTDETLVPMVDNFLGDVVQSKQHDVWWVKPQCLPHDGSIFWMHRSDITVL